MPRSPIDSLAVWKGEQLRQTDEWQVTLVTEEIDEMHTAASHAENFGRELQGMSADDFPLPTLTAKIAQ